MVDLQFMIGGKSASVGFDKTTMVVVVVVVVVSEGGRGEEEWMVRILESLVAMKK